MPADRHQPALGIAGAQRPHPQALSASAPAPIAEHRRRPSISPIRSSGWAPGRRRCADAADGKLGFSEKLRRPKNPLIIVGSWARGRGVTTSRPCARSWPRRATPVRDDWNGFAVLHTAAARVGGLGSRPGAGAGRPRRGRHPGRRARRARSDVVHLPGRRRDRHGERWARPS